MNVFGVCLEYFWTFLSGFLKVLEEKIGQDDMMGADFKERILWPVEG